MALPKSYLTSTKNVGKILNAMQAAQAPSKFNRGFLEDLGFASSTDRLLINVFKAMGLLSSDGTPTDRYFRFLDQSQAGRVLAEGLREAYSDLFQLNRQAQTMGKAELKGKMKTLTRGRASDDVVGKMATTFLELASHADWSAAPGEIEADESKDTSAPDETSDGALVDDGDENGGNGGGRLPISGLIYNVQIQLPESRDQAVYDALFKSLRAHLTQ